MSWVEGCPIPKEDYDEARSEFARLWAYARIENGPSADPGAVALKMFTGGERVKAVWILTRGHWPDDEEILDARDMIEAKFTVRDTETLCDPDVIKAQVTRSMLDLMKSQFVEAKDRVGAGKLLSEMYGLKATQGDDGVGPRGVIAMPVVSLDDYARLAYNQQQKLQEQLEDKIIDMKVVNDNGGNE